MQCKSACCYIGVFKPESHVKKKKRHQNTTIGVIFILNNSMYEIWKCSHLFTDVELKYLLSWFNIKDLGNSVTDSIYDLDVQYTVCSEKYTVTQTHTWFIYNWPSYCHFCLVFCCDYLKLKRCQLYMRTQRYPLNICHALRVVDVWMQTNNS